MFSEPELRLEYIGRVGSQDDDPTSVQIMRNMHDMLEEPHQDDNAIVEEMSHQPNNWGYHNRVIFAVRQRNVRSLYSALISRSNLNIISA